MIRSYRQIIGTPILRQEDGTLVAMIRDFIIDPDSGKIEGFWVKSLALPIRNAILKNDSILEWKKNIYIKDENEIAEAEDIIKISEILEKNTLFIGSQVKNEAGEFLGKVYDLDFDTEKLYIRQIYTQKNFLILNYDQRIFHNNTIVKVLPEYILVKDIEEKKVSEGEVQIADEKQPLMDV